MRGGFDGRNCKCELISPRIDPYTQEIQSITDRINTNIKRPRHTVIRMVKAKVK